MMARILSALVLIPVVVGTVWFLPPVWTAHPRGGGSRRLALVEYAGIARALGAHVPRAVTSVAVVAACALGRARRGCRWISSC